MAGFHHGHLGLLKNVAIWKVSIQSWYVPLTSAGLLWQILVLVVQIALLLFKYGSKGTAWLIDRLQLDSAIVM